MKKIEAIIRASKFDDVKKALSEIGINFFTFMEVKGYGKQKGEHVVYRGAVYDVGYIARIRLDIVIDAEMELKVVEAIAEAARSGDGEMGDGKIFVMPIERILSIRTKLENESAI